MSRIIVLEVPDKYKGTARDILNVVKEKYPDAEVRLLTSFEWWKEYCKKLPFEKLLPLVPPHPQFEKNVDAFMKDLRHPKSYEERNAAR